MLWLAIHLPRLPLEALPVPLPAPKLARCVVDDGVVCAADDAARARGVTPGLTPATATALAPEVMHCLRERVREAEFVRGLALALSALTPHVVVETEEVLLEVRGSLRLFGGVRALLRRVRHIAAACGGTPRLGLAPTAQAAQLLARCPGPGRERSAGRRRALRLSTCHRLLEALPAATVLEALALPERLASLLQAIGSRTVRDVRALPRGGLQRRGGGPLLRALDHAFGDAPDPRRWFEPPPGFAADLELMHRADDAQMLGHAAARLVQMLAGWLSRQWLAATRLRLVLCHERGREHPPDTELIVGLGEASRDADHLMVILQERLQRLVLAAPVYHLRLVLDAAEPCPGHEGSLLPDETRHAQDFHALLDRLSARLGHEQVRRLALHADHRPERAYVVRSALEPAAAPGVEPPAQLPRPLWLVEPAQPLAEQAGRPVHAQQPLVLLTQAERIEAGWFDGALVCRDYYVAEGRDQRLRWIYRERRGQGPQARIGWYLHGLFG